MQQDFVVYERAVGYRSQRLIMVFVLRNSVTTPVTPGGPDVRKPDLRQRGRRGDLRLARPRLLHVQAILSGDQPGYAGGDLLVGAIYAVVNILVDLILGLLDPRLIEQKG